MLVPYNIGPLQTNLDLGKLRDALSWTQGSLVHGKVSKHNPKWYYAVLYSKYIAKKKV